MKYKKQLSFTLIELLVVIAIVGILSGLIVLYMNSATESARIAKLKVYGNSIRDMLGNNLVSEWKLDDNINDSWSINNGTLINGVFISSDCIEGSCVYLDGNYDYINLGNNSALVDVFNNNSAFTYGVWFYPTAFPPTSYWYWIFCKAYTSHISPYYQVDLMLRPTGTIRSRIFNNSFNAYIPEAVSIGSVSINKWYYAAVAVDLSNGLHKLYLDGVLVSSQSGISGTYSNYSTSLAIGTDSNINGTMYNFIGKIDEFRLYNSMLSASIIKQNYLVGLEKLLANGEITQSEYDQRIASLRQSISVSEEK